ncbi:type III secretion system export apparatus subunit SctT [Chitinivorax sp. PXF-14]|uniref:type III secretion system export apparatus subunit SctT n=1 Tax=Chitinivorax sp. PXF-14 TaxID=3230488 RepID=UPI003465C686
MNDWQVLQAGVMGFALAVPRLAAAFMVLPLLTQETLPAMTRNIFLVALALIVYPLIARTIQVGDLAGLALVPVVLKELFLGVVMGYSFSIVFWAIETAGQMIDTKVGTTTAQIADPIAGHQVSLTSAFMSRFASWLFVSSGGLMVFLELLLTSYRVWPVASPLPELTRAGELFFIERFDHLLVLSLLLAAPALVVMSIVDLALGLVNRFAQQLNVFSLSMPIKAWFSLWIVMLGLGTVVQFVADHVADNRGLLGSLQQVLPPAPR